MVTILIADDSESIRTLVSSTLEEAGYTVLVGEDGQDAQKHMNGQTIDMLITDLNMPNKNGIELIADVRAHATYGTIPCVLLTTESQAEKKVEAKKAGATGWIVKPFDREKLISIVKKVLR